MEATQTAGPTDRRLYDSGRGVYYLKPRLRGWSHLVCFVVSLGTGTVLLVRASGAVETTALTIYATAVSGLFGASALYHRGNWGPRAASVLQRLDHVMIFMMIAGTATPPFLLSARGRFGLIGVTVLWTLTAVAVIIHLFWMSAPEKLVGATFIAFGWTAGLSLPAVWVHAGVAAAILMVAGGLLYTAGALSYHRRRPDPSPAVFGYHEVFHLYVCAAAACQYVAIGCFIA